MPNKICEIWENIEQGQKSGSQKEKQNFQSKQESLDNHNKPKKQLQLNSVRLSYQI